MSNKSTKMLLSVMQIEWSQCSSQVNCDKDNFSNITYLEEGQWVRREGEESMEVIITLLV